MKIIDLLNKIANDEEVPKKIMYDGKIYKYQGDDYLYKDEDRHEHWLFSESYTEKVKWLDEFLNDEVEIIDEPKEDEIKKMIELSNYQSTDMYAHKNKINEIINKINELIDEVNKLKENK